MPNRIVDIDYFDEALAEFDFPYKWYVEDKLTLDELGKRISKFNVQTIKMSLQPQEASLNQRVEGNYQSLKYNWYCRAIYRVNIGDFFEDENGNFLHVDTVQNYDGFGVRRGSCTMVDLHQYKNLEDYIKYLNGEKIL